MKVKDRLRFGNKNKNFVFYFVFRSPCTTFVPNIGIVGILSHLDLKRIEYKDL